MLRHEASPGRDEPGTEADPEGMSIRWSAPSERCFVPQHDREPGRGTELDPFVMERHEASPGRNEPRTEADPEAIFTRRFATSERCFVPQHDREPCWWNGGARRQRVHEIRRRVTRGL